MKAHLQNFSLNMLLVLDSLCRNQNTVRAAEELNISQPAVSQHIKRLKELTGEELFIRTHQGLEPTGFCLELRDRALEILDLCEAFPLKEAQEFDPAVSDREFTVAVPLEKTGFYFERITLRLKKQYPDLKMNSVYLPMEDALNALENRAVDIYIGAMPDNLRKSFDTDRIAKLGFKVICSRASPFFKKGKLSKKEFIETPHIKTAVGKPSTILDGKLRKLGIYQDTLISVPSQEMVTQLLVQGNYLYIADEQDAAFLCKGCEGLRILDVNFKLPTTEFFQIWDRHYGGDPALIWLKSYIAENCRRL